MYGADLGPIIAGTVSHVYGGSAPYMVFAAVGLWHLLPWLGALL